VLDIISRLLFLFCACSFLANVIGCRAENQIAAKTTCQKGEKKSQKSQTQKKTSAQKSNVKKKTENSNAKICQMRSNQTEKKSN